jgi:hypothetical protein
MSVYLWSSSYSHMCAATKTFGGRMRFYYKTRQIIDATPQTISKSESSTPTCTHDCDEKLSTFTCTHDVDKHTRCWNVSRSTPACTHDDDLHTNTSP